MKNQCREEVNTLKRKLAYRTPYDELVTKKKMANLKKEVKSTRNLKPLTNDLPAGLELVDNTL
jgi:hypothetical protein